MADTKELRIKIISDLETLEKTHKALDYKENPSDQNLIDAKIKAAHDLLNLSDLTNKQLIRLQSHINEISDTIKKQLKKIKHLSPEMIEIQNSIDKKETELGGKRERLRTIKKQGRLNDKNEFDFFTTTLDQYVQDAGLKFGKDGSKQVRSYKTFEKHMDQGKAKPGFFTNPEQAEELWTRLHSIGDDNAKNIIALTDEIKELQDGIKQLAKDLDAEEKKTPKSSDTGPGTVGGIELIKSNSDTLIDQWREENTARKDANKQTTDINKQAEDLKKKEPSGFGKLAKQFTLYAVALRAAKNIVREAIGTVKELDKYLTEQAMVTGKTRKETYALVGAYQDLATATGSTTKEVAQVATEYMKQGKSTKEALVLTEAAISAAKVARVSVGDSVNYLTTALNGFRLSADQAMAVSDKFAAVAASSATDYDELAIALSKVASQANLAGMSIDYTTALLTKGLETTREAPETMGTALKTVIARMREIKDYGETLEGDTNINNVEKQLATVQIHLRDQKGELRSTQDVLDELGNKWDTLNKNQQAAIAKALAGTRQQSRLIAMMEGYERVTELQQIAERSQGATYAQMGTHLEGMEAAMNRVHVAIEKIVTTVTNSDFIIGIIDHVGAIINDIANILSNPAGMIAAVTTLSIISLSILGTQLREKEIAQIQYELDLADMRAKIQKDLIEKKITAEKAKQLQLQQAALDPNQIGGFKGLKSLGAVTKNLFSSLGKGGKIGLAIAGVTALSYGIYKLGKRFHWWGYGVKEVAQDINKLSNEIYKLNEKANAIGEVNRKFDDLNNKVLKTNKDIKEMNSLLESARDKLSDEEKEQFDILSTPEQKAQFLKDIEKVSRTKARNKQKEQIKLAREHPEVLTSEDPEAIKAQTAIKVAANSKLYEVIDSTTDLTKEQAHATEQLTAAILAEMTAEEALEYADDNDNMKRLIDLTSQHAAVLQDEEESLINRRNAYLDMLGVLNEDQVALQKFKSAYKEWEFFADMSDQALQFIDDMKLSNDAVNDLFNSGTIFNKKMAQYAKENKIEWSNIDTEQFKTQLTNALDDINTDFSNFEEVLEDNFKDIIDVTDKNGAEWNALVESIGDQFGTSVLNMGQNMTKFKNNINSFYENANKWTDLSEDQKAEFISENADLFKGQQGAELLEALQNNDYERMEAALQNSDVMKENRKTQLEEVNRTLQIELAKGEEAQNKAYIKQLEDHKKFLEDDKNLYKVSIKTRLEQQEKQLSEYKNMLQKEHEALQKSLDKRKEAYQKYFDTINEQKDDEEYEEQAQLLVANISKLGSDSTGTAAAQRADLEKQLQELEKERLEELRQHAQEKVMENLDKQVEEINEKFDKLIDSNHELLLAMQHDLDSTKGKAQFLTDLLSTKAASGATDIEMQNYLQDLRGSFGGQFSGLWDKLDIKESNGNLYLNVNGQEVLLNQNDQQSVFEAVMQALRAIGK